MNNLKDIQKIILFGAGGEGRRLLHQLGDEKVYAFCDNYKAGETIEGKDVIDLNVLKELSISKNYKVIICVLSPYIACEIAEQLEDTGIEYELCEKGKGQSDWDLMHIIDGDIVYASDTDCSQNRKNAWYKLYKQMLEKYKKDFMNKSIDFWIHLGDTPEKAYWAVKLGILKTSTIFSFCTTNELKDIVIPVPDYMYYALPNGFDLPMKYDESIEEYKRYSKLPWISKKAFWTGNLDNHDSRVKLYQLGREYPEDLEIVPYSWNGKTKWISMTELYQYKYLIDARGYGWTDRLKILFLLERPIFINKRPYIEFWMTYGLKAEKHYIAVNEDFSDLLKRKKELDHSPEKYENMVKEMHLYAEKYLTKDFALEYLKTVILKYGVQEKIR